MGERLAGSQKVIGSSPLSSTLFFDPSVEAMAPVARCFWVLVRGAMVFPHGPSLVRWGSRKTTKQHDNIGGWRLSLRIPRLVLPGASLRSAASHPSRRTRELFTG